MTIASFNIIRLSTGDLSYVSQIRSGLITWNYPQWRVLYNQSNSMMYYAAIDAASLVVIGYMK